MSTTSDVSVPTLTPATDTFISATAASDRWVLFLLSHHVVSIVTYCVLRMSLKRNTRQLHSTTALCLLLATTDMHTSTLVLQSDTLSCPRRCLETVNIKRTLFACCDDRMHKLYTDHAENRETIEVTYGCKRIRRQQHFL